MTSERRDLATNKFENSVVLITGGTGSFGSTMARDLLKEGVGELRIFSRDEAKQDRLRNELSDKRIRFFIGDTRDSSALTPAVRGANYIFHAAAMKQVPASEFFPLEAVKTNVHGSSNVLGLALDSEVDGVVCLSTDKAVYPINAMGQSKALMEKLAQAMSRTYPGSKTRIMVTRYGNVMMSRGSVIPLMLEQIDQGLPLTVTNTKMTRFLMTLDESVDLVKFALTEGTNGDILVRKAPATTIGILVEAIRQIRNLPNHPTKNIGTRHGEKLFESLLSEEERAKSQDLGDYFKVPVDARDLNYEEYFEKGDIRSDESAAYTSHNTERLDVDDVVALLKVAIDSGRRRAGA